MLIGPYEFGAIVINGKRYKSDVIVLPGRVIDGWWRAHITKSIARKN
jgi:hypothetical protein